MNWCKATWFFSHTVQLREHSASYPMLGWSFLKLSVFILPAVSRRVRGEQRCLFWLKASPNWPRDKFPIIWRSAVKNEPIVCASLYLAVCNKKSFYIALKKTILTTFQFHETEKLVTVNDWMYKVPIWDFCLGSSNIPLCVDKTKTACLLESNARP
jgi:hypothetical protein